METTKGDGMEARYEVSGWTPDGDYATADVRATSEDEAVRIAREPGYSRATIIEVGDVTRIG
jgi:hypothetical protein